MSAHISTSEMDAGRKIVTSFIHPPIPTRAMDWCAFYDGDEERGEYGYGPTEAEAIADLVDSFPEED